MLSPSHYKQNTTQSKVIATVKAGVRMEHEDLICPVCRKYTFEEYADYDICPTCGWENDGVQFDDHNYAGGANEDVSATLCCC